MKKFLLCSVLVISCFAQLEFIKEDKAEARSGFFFGADIGVGVNVSSFLLQSANKILYKSNPTFPSLVMSGKIGGVSYFTKRYGLRYYYNLDGNLLFGEEKEYGKKTGFNQFYTLSTTHTLNVDAIFNLFASKNLELSLIGGIGGGIITGECGVRNQTILSNKDTYRFTNFEFRVNLGTRVMFDQKYGIEFMAKVPVTPTASDVTDGNNPSFTIKTAPYYFSLGFVIERF